MSLDQSVKLQFLLQSLFRGVCKEHSQNRRFHYLHKLYRRKLGLLIILFSGINLAISDDLPDFDACKQLDLRIVGQPIEGWCLMINPHKGNCLVCHFIRMEGRTKELSQTGNMGPILEHIPEKYSDQSELIEYLNDPVTQYPNTIKPPYGKHHILTETEIEAVVGFFWFMKNDEK
ncbi:MAG: hypothetical protein OXE41_10880 [Gammaproteobacteria bacterium]|nr:hypothetical protein [Gammaproteobacteria bacterium]MCY4218844.1 hypothetical protein [Gammaproteobacteria bacterium]MCY4275879.1 hypothetical protein [Gammaproteobacteria bacterium]